MLLWVAGNAPIALVRSLITSIGEEKGQTFPRRGLVVDDHFRVKGANGIWALGDCACANLPQTAQVRSLIFLKAAIIKFFIFILFYNDLSRGWQVKKRSYSILFFTRVSED
jgi:hypothetical protein